MFNNTCSTSPRADIHVRPIISRKDLLVRSNSKSSTTANKISVCQEAHIEELIKIKSTWHQHLHDRKCKCDIDHISITEIQSIRHCKNLHDSGKLAGSKRKPSENAEWLLGEIVHSRKRFKHESIQTNSDTTKSRFIALGTTTCSTCFRQLYAIGKTSYHRALLSIANTTADNKRPNALATRETLSSVCKRSHDEDVTNTN